MRKFYFLFLLLLMPSLALASAFPGAVGYGANATGGRGGTVLFVTNTNDSGPGSLRAALSATGPRTVIFRTGGTVLLTSDVVIYDGDLTVAGQTAPGGGFCASGATILIKDSNVIMRGLKIRPGDLPTGPAPSNRDGLQIDNPTYGLTDIIIDHNSITWSIDELATVWNPNMRKITFSHNIFAEALYDSIHPDGPHSMGPLMGQDTLAITFYANLFAHNNGRNPKIRSTTAEVINNVVYDRGDSSIRIGDSIAAQQINVIGNVFKRGNSYKSNPYDILFDNAVAATRVYENDNLVVVPTGLPIYNSANYISGAPFPGSGIVPKPSSEVLAYVATHVGANPTSPDAVDARIINQLNSTTGGLVNSVAQAGGYPTLVAGTPPADFDDDGMPDAWETAWGLNPNDPADRNYVNQDGYTNLEIYINSFYVGGSTFPPDPVPPPPDPLGSVPGAHVVTTTNGQPCVVTANGQPLR